MKFKKREMKGFPLSKINAELGTTKDIQSILTTTEEEKSLLSEITEEDDIDDKHDVVVDSWMRRLGEGHAVWFEEMYKEDVAVRLEEEPKNAVNEEVVAIEQPENTYLAKLAEVVNSMNKYMGGRMRRIEEKVDRLDKRVATLEDYVKKQGETEKEGGKEDYVEPVVDSGDNAAHTLKKKRDKGDQGSEVEENPIARRPMTRARKNKE